jgi:uncharacterized protein YbaP (TraB family)
MRRREVALALCSLAVAPSLIAAKAAARGPLFWRAKRSNATVYLLGVAEAKDRTWFTPTIQAAFEQSSTLWEEIAPPPSLEHVNQLYEQYGFDSQRTFFDALDPRVRERAERYRAELGIDGIPHQLKSMGVDLQESAEFKSALPRQAAPAPAGSS